MPTVDTDDPLRPNFCHLTDCSSTTEHGLLFRRISKLYTIKEVCRGYYISDHDGGSWTILVVEDRICNLAPGPKIVNDDDE